MNKLLLLTLLCFSLFSTAQTDESIAKALLGTKEAKIINTLNDLGLWYVIHNNVKDNDLIYCISIESESGVIKLYQLQVGVNKIKKVIVTYSHDNKQHLIDLIALNEKYNRKVTKYYTEVIFRK